MALYGYKAMPQRSSDPYKDYFKEVREGIDSRALIDEAKKTAEEAAISSIGGIPDLGPNSMFMSYSDPYKQMATILKENKDEMLKTPEGRQEYQALMDAAIQFSTDGKAQTAYVNPLLQRNMQIAKSGVTPQEWKVKGMEDSHSYEDYVEYTRAIDTARYQVGMKGGKWVLSDGNQEYAPNDDRLFSRKYFENNLVMSSAKPPEQWWPMYHQDSKYKDEDEALRWVEATVSDDARQTLDAVRWAHSKGMFGDMTVEEAKAVPGRVEEAVTAYARAAVPEGWKKEDQQTRPSSSSTSQDEEVFTISDDDIYRSSSDSAGFYPNEDDTDLIQNQDVASMQPPQPILVRTETWNNSPVEQGSTQAFKVGGMEINTEEGLVIITSNGERLPIERGSMEFGSLRTQVDRELGEGAFDKIFNKLRGAAYEHEGDLVGSSQWRLDHLDVTDPSNQQANGTFSLGGRIRKALFG